VLIAPASVEIPCYQGILQGKLRFYGFQSQSPVRKALCRSGFLPNSLRTVTGKLFWITGNFSALTGNHMHLTVVPDQTEWMQ
jgi:hypothetical protein